jgi:hypothetical protein
MREVFRSEIFCQNHDMSQANNVSAMRSINSPFQTNCLIPPNPPFNEEWKRKSIAVYVIAAGGHSGDVDNINCRENECDANQTKKIARHARHEPIICLFMEAFYDFPRRIPSGTTRQPGAGMRS